MYTHTCNNKIYFLNYARKHITKYDPPVIQAAILVGTFNQYVELFGAYKNGTYLLRNP